MINLEASAEDMISIVAGEIRGINKSIYHNTLYIKVAKQVDDGELLKKSQDAVVRLEKMKDALTKELENLESQNKEHV